MFHNIHQLIEEVMAIETVEIIIHNKDNNINLNMDLQEEEIMVDKI
jgi:hypothetical protein